jgi:hypothetical protein
LSPQQWDELSVARLAGFWHFAPEPFPNPIVADGAVWVFEARVAGEHRILVQHSPSATAFRSMCKLMLSLAPIAPSELELDLLE